MNHALSETERRLGLPGLEVSPVSGSAGQHALPPLERGSQVELGRALLTLVRGEGAGPELVFDEGQFHHYEEATGLWRAVPHLGLERRLHEYDGYPLPGRGTKTTPLRLSQHAILGAIGCAAAEAFQAEFFRRSMPGLSLTNGFLTVAASGPTLLPHSPEHRATVGMAFAFARESAAPRFARFLDEVFLDDPDAGAKRALLQEYVGIALAGIATRYAAALILIGDGANGKSVLLRVLASLFPANAIASVSPQSWDQEYRLALLAGVRLNCVSEMPEREILASETFKAVVSGEEVIGRRIREAPFRFRPIAGHIFAGNQLPGIVDQSRGFWRRVLPLRFNRTFAEHEQDRTLAEQIVARELPGVTVWAIDGAVRALANGQLTLPPSVLEARGAWQYSADQVRQFLDDCVTLEPGGSASAGLVYRHYARWADDQGHRRLSSVKLGMRLAALGYPSQHTRTGSIYPFGLKTAPLGQEGA